jgi:hypothetical protein
MTRFPAEELMVTAGRYMTAVGELRTTRETQSHLNRDGDGTVSAVVESAQGEAEPAQGRGDGKD